MKRNLLLGRILSVLISGFFFHTALSQAEMAARDPYHQNSDGFYYDEPPLQGYVKQVTQAVYRAVVYHGIIGKDSVLIHKGDTLQFKPDGTLNKRNSADIYFFYHPTDSIAYLYDKDGRCLKQTTYYPNRQLKESRSFIYDQTGKIKLCIIRDAAEETIDAISYSYDPYGKLAIKIINRKDGEMRQQRFAYDSHGNWIIRVDFKEYEPVYYVERTILYY